MTRYDLAIVGGGSAGALLAARLSEDSSRRVVLVEAGGEAVDPDIWDPAAWPALQGRSYDWDYRTEPQAGTAGRAHRWARGRAVGGSSLLHAMGHMRGHPADFAAWAEATGDARWSWEGLLPAFMAIEDHSLGGDGIHGKGGPRDRVLFRDALAAAREIGHRPELDGWRERELLPGPLETQADVDRFIAEAAITHHHPSGTCRMGKDKRSVVDADLRLRGLDNLHVVDGSVIPSLTAGPIHAPILAVAETFVRTVSVV